jgi:hypothetical protein
VRERGAFGIACGPHLLLAVEPRPEDLPADEARAAFADNLIPEPRGRLDRRPRFDPGRSAKVVALRFEAAQRAVLLRRRIAARDDAVDEGEGGLRKLIARRLRDQRAGDERRDKETEKREPRSAIVAEIAFRFVTVARRLPPAPASSAEDYRRAGH